MINRFNFFDLYGYVVPGLSLLGLIWLPFGLTGSAKMPDLAAALGLLVLAYVVGHLLHIIAERAIPPKVRDSKGELRYPSHVLIVGDDPALPNLRMSNDLRRGVTRKAEEWFKDRLGPSDPALLFLLCRSALVQRGKGGYAEQMQGMYTLLQGLTASLILASGYYLGWCLSRCTDEEFTLGIMGLVFGAFPITAWLAFRELDFRDVIRERRFLLALAFVVLIVVGICLGGRADPGQAGRIPFFWLSLLSLVLAWMTFEQFLGFAGEFARTVYRDFAILEKCEDKPKKPDSISEPEDL